MAEIENEHVIGNFSVALTDAQVAKYTTMEGPNDLPEHGKFHNYPASFFCIDLYVLTAANNNSEDSVLFDAPFPMTLWAADVGCEACAATTGTADILVDGTSVLDAAEDIKTTAGTCVRVAPEEDSQNIAYGDSIGLRVTAGSAAALTGGVGHLWVQRA